MQSRIPRARRLPLPLVLIGVLLVTVLSGGAIAFAARGQLASTGDVHHSLTTTYKGTLGVRFIGPKRYALFLGDSYVQGYQPDYSAATASSYVWRGYSDAWTAQMRALRPGLQQVNYGCFMGTTVSFVHGNCEGTVTYGIPPRDPYPYPTDSQLDAALRFIAAHPGQVSPVEVEIGSNDFAACYNGPGLPLTPSCVSNTETTVAANLTTIFKAIRAALHGSGDVLTATSGDPFQNLDPTTTVPLTQDFNSIVMRVGKEQGVPVLDGGNTVWKLDAYPNGNNPALCGTTNPQTKAVTPYLWLCDHPETAFTGGTHPHDAGYAAIAQSYEQLTGY